jgi:DnaA-like protein
MPVPQDSGKTIVIRDRRKPSQYTTDNVVAREWLPIIRVGDAFFFYSVYLSMANKKTESSWGSLRTLAQYLQCGVDLIIRGNKLLEICELIYVETGNQRTSNEYYILDPPTLTDELRARITSRLDDILAQENSKNWQSWAKQVRKALDKHRSLPDIWADRRANRGGRPKTQLPENPARESQPGFSEKGVREPQPPRMWPTTAAHVTHTQDVRESQPEQEQLTRTHEQDKIKDPDSLQLLVQTRCHCLDIAPSIVEVLVERYGSETLAQQLDWLPFRNARDPAAMWVSAVQGAWEQPAQYDPERAAGIWAEWMGSAQEALLDEKEDVGAESEPGADEMAEESLTHAQVWERVLQELRMQMTRATFDTWLGGSQIVRMDKDEITVRVRDAYAVEWLRARWLGTVERTVAGVLGRAVALRFEV